MGIGASITLLAIGAILAFAVDATSAGLDSLVIGVQSFMIAASLGCVTMLVTRPSATHRRRR
jgi:cystathionine beta-lyase/cystathionine gamma-synthase